MSDAWGLALWALGFLTGFVLARGPREWREAWRLLRAKRPVNHITHVSVKADPEEVKRVIRDETRRFTGDKAWSRLT